jgi:hypothetical protein
MINFQDYIKKRRPLIISPRAQALERMMDLKDLRYNPKTDIYEENNDNFVFWAGATYENRANAPIK